MRKYLVLLLLIVSQRVYSQLSYPILFHTQGFIESKTGASFQGASVVDDSVAWVSGSKGWVARSINGGKDWDFIQVNGYEKCDFRSIYAFDANNAIIANAGSPAYILRTSDGGQTWKVVYQDNDTAAFFDGIDFWNDKTGIIYGDPIKGRMTILKTKDGGRTWKELPEKNRPVMAEGEASFAASGTNIRCYGKRKLMIATSGMVSRLLVSENRGKKWKTIFTDTPGKNSAGIFSFAFRNDDTGVIVFGDYKNEESGTLIHTFFGGKTWEPSLGWLMGKTNGMPVVEVIATANVWNIFFQNSHLLQGLQAQRSFIIMVKIGNVTIFFMMGREGMLSGKAEKATLSLLLMARGKY